MIEMIVITTNNSIRVRPDRPPGVAASDFAGHAEDRNGNILAISVLAIYDLAICHLCERGQEYGLARTIQ